MIAEVYLWSDGMVSVFDEHGDQLPEYQGPLAEVQARVLADAPDTARFRFGTWQRGTCDLSREHFGCIRYDHARLELLARDRDAAGAS